MKNKLKHIYSLAIIALFSLVLLGACRDDLSTLDLNPVEGVTFDTTGMAIIVAFQFEELDIQPKVITKLPEERLAYEWSINPIPGSLQRGDFEVISREKNLKYRVDFVPTVDMERWHLHELVLTVIDTQNGLKYITSYPLSVRNSIGEGLVIAETYDGQTTDISHIMSSAVTSLYSGESIKHKVYSGANGFTIPGLVKQIKWSSLRTIGNVMLAITDNSIEAIKTLDYTYAAQNEELFFTPPAVIKPMALETFKGGTTFNAFLVNDGRTYTDIIGNAGKWALPDDFPFRAPAYVAVNRRSSPDYYLSYLDEQLGSFIFKQGFASWSDRTLYQMDAAVTPFNPRGLQGKKVVAASVNEANDFIHILKDGTGSGIGVYILDGGAYGVPPKPKRYIDINNAPEIADAQFYVILPDQEVIYYATKTKIYAVMYGSTTPSYALRYTVPVGEEITTLQVFQQADYANRSVSEPYISTHNKQLIMSTYNGTEGNVYIMPFRTQGLGIIEESQIKKYNGFGRVTAIGTQL